MDHAGGGVAKQRGGSIVDGGGDAGALGRGGADKGSSEEKAHLCALVAARAATGVRGGLGAVAGGYKKVKTASATKQGGGWWGARDEAVVPLHWPLFATQCEA